MSRLGEKGSDVEGIKQCHQIPKYHKQNERPSNIASSAANARSSAACMADAPAQATSFTKASCASYVFDFFGIDIHWETI